MMSRHRTQVCTGDPGQIAAAWSRLVGDLERVGLLGAPGACDAVARTGADVLRRAETTADRRGEQGQQGRFDAP